MTTVAILAVVFLTGAITGILVLVCTSISREETGSSLSKKPPTRAAATTRRLLGWHGIPAADADVSHRRIRPAELSTGRTGAS